MLGQGEKVSGRIRVVCLVKFIEERQDNEEMQKLVVPLIQCIKALYLTFHDVFKFYQGLTA